MYILITKNDEQKAFEGTFAWVEEYAGDENYYWAIKTDRDQLMVTFNVPIPKKADRKPSKGYKQELIDNLTKAIKDYLFSFNKAICAAIMVGKNYVELNCMDIHNAMQKVVNDE